MEQGQIRQKSEEEDSFNLTSSALKNTAIESHPRSLAAEPASMVDSPSQMDKPPDGQPLTSNDLCRRHPRRHGHRDRHGLCLHLRRARPWDGLR